MMVGNRLLEDTVDLPKTLNWHQCGSLPILPGRSSGFDDCFFAGSSSTSGIVESASHASSIGSSILPRNVTFHSIILNAANFANFAGNATAVHRANYFVMKFRNLARSVRGTGISRGTPYKSLNLPHTNRTSNCEPDF